MIEIGRYLLLFVSLAGITLSDNGRFSDEDIAKFLDYIFRLHNAVRRKHDVQQLTRTENMDIIAEQKLNEILTDRFEKDALGVVLIWMPYDNTTQLNVAEAIQMFSIPYEQGNSYNYESNTIFFYEDDFTQIVWKDTDQIGITFRCLKKRYMVLSVYYPSGAIEGKYIDNVNPPINSQPASDPEIGLIYQTTPEKFLDYIFELHNKARLKHGVPPLERDDALDWAANNMLRRNTKIPPEENGINYLEGWYNDYTKLDAKKAKEKFSFWYDKGEYYDYSVEPSTDDIGYKAEFTQIVWKNTRKIGLGIKIRYGRYEVIALYKPRGNIREKFASNVFKPRSMDQREPSDYN